MPEKKVLDRAKEDARQGKSVGTQAGEFVREEFEHIREGKHGARSSKQAIAIGLSKARRAGIPLKAPKAGSTSEETRRKAARDSERGRNAEDRPPSRTRSRATQAALQREGHSAGSKLAISRQTRAAARKRSAAARSESARKASATKGRTGRSQAARKAARRRAARKG